MADKPVRPRIPAVNVPATTVAAISAIGTHLTAALEASRALDQRDTPQHQNTHDASYEALHDALEALSRADAFDGVTRFGADISCKISLFMLCEDQRHQAYLLDHSLRFLDLAIGCDTDGFGERDVKDGLRQIRASLDALAPYHSVFDDGFVGPLSDPEP